MDAIDSSTTLETISLVRKIVALFDEKSEATVLLVKDCLADAPGGNAHIYQHVLES